MAAFGLDLDSPLEPNVDAYINPTKDDDTHRSALNAVVLRIHRAGAGGFEGLVSKNLGDYITNPDAKVRERAVLLLTEVLGRLPELPLLPGSAARFATFFASRLADYPSVVPALGALSNLVKHHASALLESKNVPDAGGGGDASKVEQESEAEEGGSAGAIARAVFEELHLPALSQRIRQAALSLLRALVSDSRLREALSLGMGVAFVKGLVGCLEGEKDPRCLIVALSTLRRVQEGFDEAVLEETSEAVFDATSCYFPVTFTPPPNDPHNISPDALKTGLEEVLIGSPGMARYVIPMLLDKLSSEVSAAKEASLKALVAGVRSFGPTGVSMHLRPMGAAVYQEAVHGSDPDLSALAQASLTEIVREAASYAEFTGEGEASPEWRALARPLFEAAVSEVAGDQPCSVLGRGSAKVLQALASSSALGLRSALALAVPPILRVRAQAEVASRGEAMVVEEDSSGDLGNGGIGSGTPGVGVTAVEDAQAARLTALAGLISSVDDKVDFSGSERGAPLSPYVESLFTELSTVLTRANLTQPPREGSYRVTRGDLGRIAPAACSGCFSFRIRVPLSWSDCVRMSMSIGFIGGHGASVVSVCVATRGLNDIITRPPVALMGEESVKTGVSCLASILHKPGAWSESGAIAPAVDSVKSIRIRVPEESIAYAALSALRAIGLRRPEYEQIVLDAAVPRLVDALVDPDSSEADGVTSAAKTTDNTEGSGLSNNASQGVDVADQAVSYDNVGRALSALVELSEMPRVFGVAAPAMLAAAASVNGTSGGAKPVLGDTPTAELALRALDDALKRAAKQRQTPELVGFIRGVSPTPAPATFTPVPAGVSQSVRTKGTADAPDNDELWGLPLILAALEGSSPASLVVPSPAESGSSVGGVVTGTGEPSEGISGIAGRAAVSAVRTCTLAAPTEDQDAVLASLLSRVVCSDDPGADPVVSKGMLLPALAAVMGAVGCDSRALAPGGEAAAAVPALLRAALDEETAKRDDMPVSYPSCCQCLAAVLNKLASGPELDANVALVVEALRDAFVAQAGTRKGVGDRTKQDKRIAKVENERLQGRLGPVECLAWTLKAVAMRVGLSSAFVELLDLLCGLLHVNDGSEGGTRLSGEQRRRRALAASGAFGTILADGGDALEGGLGSSSARISPLWRQRFFIQAFPRLIILVKNNRGNKKPLKDSCTQASGTPGLAEGPACTNCSNRDGNGVGEGTPSDEGSANEGDFSYIPALWALLNVVKGVPSEALSPELDSVIPAVVQALRSGHIPLQTAAVETFQVLSKSYLAAFGEHLSSVIPALLDLAEACGGSGVTGETNARPAAVGPRDRYRSLQCLTTIAKLPYARVHPFKYQVTRRLRGPLDDPRRAVRRAAAHSRNVWFLLS